MGAKQQPPRNKDTRSFLFQLADRIGWGRTIALVVVVGIGISFIPKSPKPLPAHHRTHTEGPGDAALKSGLEWLRLETKKIFFDPAYEEYQRTHKHHRGEPSYPPIALANMRFTLGPRRIRAAKGDKGVPPHREDHHQEDWRRYKIGYGTSPVTSTNVFFFITEENVAPQNLKATVGILTLRDKTGEALYRQLWHFPDDHPGALLKKRVPYHTTFADMDRSTSTWNFRKVLFTPESDLTLQWTPMFVCYADGTMAGDVRPYLALWGDDLDQVPTVRWIANLQYPNGIPTTSRR